MQFLTRIPRSAPVGITAKPIATMKALATMIRPGRPMSSWASSPAQGLSAMSPQHYFANRISSQHPACPQVGLAATSIHNTRINGKRDLHMTGHPLQQSARSQPAPDSISNNVTHKRQDQQPEFRLHSVFDDTSDRWEDWLSSVEYLDPWDVTDVIPLKDDPSLDTASRHLMSLLQQRYFEGHAFEAVTSHRCQGMIGNLLKGDLDTYHGLPRALRSNTILKLMELFWDRVPNLAQTADRLLLDDRESRRRSQTIVMQPVTEYPLPNLAAYSTLLRVLAAMQYSKEERRAATVATIASGGSSALDTTIPDMALEVVLRMTRAYNLKGVHYMKQPGVVEWNQVLSAWGLSCHPQKAARAAECFLTMTQPPHEITPDPSSFGHLFRACAHHNENKMAKQLGAQVALKVWRGTLPRHFDESSSGQRTSPRMIAFFCQAIQNLEQDRERDEYIEQAWEKACSHGVVNEHVLASIMTAPVSSWRKLLGPFKSANETGDHITIERECREILQQLPKAWVASVSETSNQ